MWYKYAIKHVKKIYLHPHRKHHLRHLRTNPFAEEIDEPMEVNDNPATLEQNQNETKPKYQDILSPNEPAYVTQPTQPDPHPNQQENLPQNIQQNQPVQKTIDPDVQNSQTLEPLKVKQNQPTQTNMPSPPIHENCHCEIVTMPGGNQIWRAGNKPCVDCANARDIFNTQNSQNL